MKQRMPTSQPNTNKVRVRMKVDLQPLSLDKSYLRQLGEIVLKSNGNVIILRIEGKSENIVAESIESLVNARLPKEPRCISLDVWSTLNCNQIIFGISDIGSIMTFCTIEVSRRDVNRVSARVKELENFITHHKNFHWIFQNWWSLLFQAIILGWFILFNLKDQIWGFPIAITIVCVYVPLVRTIFPFIVLDSERKSAITILRKFLIWAIPLILVGLLVNLLSKFLMPS